TLTSNTRHQSSGSSSQDSPRAPVPAFATRRSTSPASANQAVTSSRALTSPTSARPPISAATLSTCSAVRPVTVTSIPAVSGSRALFAPIPRPPPVINAVCPARLSTARAYSATGKSRAELPRPLRHLARHADLEHRRERLERAAELHVHEHRDARPVALRREVHLEMHRDARPVAVEGAVRRPLVLADDEVHRAEPAVDGVELGSLADRLVADELHRRDVL